MLRLTATAWLLIAAGSLSAQESPAELMAGLSSKNYAVREKAARKLELLGPPAVPLLKKLAASTDLETSRRALLIIERIKERQDFQELTTATPTQFRFQDMPIDDALRQIEQRTRLRLDIAGNRRVNVSTGTLPFWQAWRHFREAAHLHEDDYALHASPLKPLNQTALRELQQVLERRDMDFVTGYRPPPMRLAPSAGRAYSADERKSIRVRVRAIERTSFDKMPHVTMAIELRAEPRLDIVTMPRVEITKYVDDAGTSHAIRAAAMLPGHAGALPSAELLAHVTGEVQYGGLLHFRMLPVPAALKRFKELHGEVRVEVQHRRRLIEIGNVLAAEGKSAQSDRGVSIHVLKAKKLDRDGVELLLRLDKLDSLVPAKMEERMIRTRTGLLVERGPADFALERLRIIDRSGAVCDEISESYVPTKTGQAYDLTLTCRGFPAGIDGVSLVMTEQPRKVLIVMPFAVSGVELPAR